MARQSAKLIAAAIGTLAAFLAVPADPAQASLITFKEGISPTGAYTAPSATIRSDQGNNNYGADAITIVGKTTTPAVLRSVYAFDVSDIPDGAPIDGATLRLTVSSSDGTSISAPITLELYQLSASFTEGAGNSSGANNGNVSWNFRGPTSATTWGAPGGDFSPTLLASITANPRTVAPGTLVDFVGEPAFVSAIQAASDANATLYLVVKSAAVVESANVREIFFFASDENTNTAYRPALTVSYVPEPASAAVVAIGAIGLLARRRRGTSAGR